MKILKGGESTMAHEGYLGRMGTDIISGFQGTIIGRVYYLTGCSQFLLTPKSKSAHEKPASEWIDVDRIKISGKPIKIQVSHPGNDLAAPIKG